MKDQLLKEFKLLLGIFKRGIIDSKAFMIPRMRLLLKYILSSEEERSKFTKDDRDTVTVVGYLLLTPFIFIVAPVIILKVVYAIIW